MAQSLEAKIVVLGAQGVGKTSLVHRYVKNQFSPANMTSTVGASFLTKRVVDDDSDTVVRLQIWDTAGQERFRSISRLYYRGANACILCYSINDSPSFHEMGIWLTELRRNLPPDIILHIVGTKADIVARSPQTREVPFERCIAYVAEHLSPDFPSAVSVGMEPGSGGSAGGSGYYRGFLSGRGERGGGGGGRDNDAGGEMGGARSPSSKRSSGFWGQEIGWDCCHEVSAESGEGVDEVFRVITRRLVAQNQEMQDKLLSAQQTPGLLTPGVDGMGGEGGYFDGIMGGRPGGSFRVGRDRRSWFGVPVENFVDQSDGGQEVKAQRKCC